MTPESKNDTIIPNSKKNVDIYSLIGLNDLATHMDITYLK